MISRPRHCVMTVFTVAIGVLMMSGCTETKRPAAPVKNAAAAANAKADALVQQGLSAAAEPAAPAAQPADAASPSAPTPAATDGSDAAASSATSVDDLVKKLAAATDSRDRVVVIDEIGAIGQNALPALDGLIAAFTDAEPRVRWHAARAVGLIGEDALGAVPRLLALLDDADPLVVTQAAAALGSIREDDGRPQIPASDAAVYASAVEPLAKVAVHADPRARRAAIRALRRYRSPADMAPIVSRHLSDAEPAVVMAALHTLADMGSSAVPFLVESLKDPKSRYWAEVALSEIGPEAAAATESLAPLVAEGQAEERLQALLALAAIGDKASSTGPAIAAVLEAGDPALLLPAAFALGRIKSAAGDAQLAKLAAGDEPFLAGVAAWALARIHPDDKALVGEAFSRLRTGLSSPDPEVRAGCVNGLSDLAESLGDDGRSDLAAEFLRLLDDKDPEAGRAAGAALIRLGGAAVPALRGKLSDAAMRQPVLEILSAIGPAAKPAIDDLMKALDDANPEIRGDAAVVLGSIGREAAAAAPALQKLLADPAAPEGLRYAAAFAIGRIGPDAVVAEPALRELIQSKDEFMSTVAVWAALKIRPTDATLFETAVPLLRRALRAEREMVRLEAAVALGDIGPAAASAIPMLELVAEDDPVKQVREAAAASLAKVRGK